jgi:hypothetical protein
MVFDFACLEEVMDGGPVVMDYENDRMSGRRMGALAHSSSCHRGGVDLEAYH